MSEEPRNPAQPEEPRGDFPQTEQPAGSPEDGEPVFLVVGKLRRPHGLHGEIVMDVYTDFPERLRRGVWVYVGQDRQVLRIRSRRPHGAALLLGFHGYDSPEAVGELRNEMVYVPATDRPKLPEGEYYHHQVLGLRVVDENGRYLGQVKQILSSGANDVYIVQPPGGPEILLPATEEVILAIDLDSGEMRVHLLPGLLADE